MDIRKVLAVTISMIFSALAPLYEAQASSERPLVSVVHEGIRFCESVYPYNGGIYISNFGSEELTPKEGENKGYILYRKDGVTKTVAPADGTLHQPTSMTVKGDYLFVADKTRLVVYHMTNWEEKPQIVAFPEGNESGA